MSEPMQNVRNIFKPKLNAMERATTTTLVGRNIRVNGRRTSARLEPSMWTAFYDIARREGRHVDDIASEIALLKRPETSLTAALRVFIMAYYKEAATEQGHKDAGHGMRDLPALWTNQDALAKALHEASAALDEAA
jgi:predicted DNA-binding ribbon-helix-helix protein